MRLRMRLLSFQECGSDWDWAETVHLCRTLSNGISYKNKVSSKAKLLDRVLHKTTAKLLSLPKYLITTKVVRFSCSAKLMSFTRHSYSPIQEWNNFFCCAHPILPKESIYQQYVCVQWNSKEGKEGTQKYITDNTPLAKLSKNNKRNLFHSWMVL